MPRDDDDYDDRPRRPRREDEDDYDDRPRRRRRDEDDYDDRPRPSGKDGSNGLAVVGLILGVVSLCFGFLLGIPAIICSVIAMKKPAGKGMAITGLILGIVGTLGTILTIALLLPAVQKVRGAASRAQESNNLKQVVLGALNYQSSYNRFPSATDSLSWRVHILPFIEQQNLYQSFNLQQAWDSPANRQLANTLVKTYTSPEDPPGTTETHYRVFVGPGTIYEPGKPPKRIQEITDGTSNTIFAIESTDMVPWPQPKELEFTRNGPLPEVGHKNRTLVLIGMADGSVRSVDKTKLDPTLFRELITANGGEVSRDW